VKKCSQCGIEQDESNFYKSGSGRLRSECKDCGRPQSQKRMAIAYQENPEKFRDRSRRWGSNNRAKKTSWDNRYRLEHPEVAPKSREKWKILNPRLDKESKDRWRDANREQENKKARERSRLFPEKGRSRRQRRRACLRDRIIEKFLDIEIFERDNYICGLCHKAIDPLLRHPHPLSVSLDHIIAIANGGDHTCDNVQASHLVCNQSKGNRI